MNTPELIYQEARDLPESEAQEVLDFMAFLKAKRHRTPDQAVSIREAENTGSEDELSEFDSFCSVYGSNFDKPIIVGRHDRKASLRF